MAENDDSKKGDETRFNLLEILQNPERFDPGRVVITPSALQSLMAHDIVLGLARHVRGDWGMLDDADRLENDRALAEGDRLLSAYRSPAGTRYWIITEWDRSTTTVLLPEDY